MTTATIERKYAMTRIGAGDYMFLSNDGRVLWRVYRYQEDGTLEINGKPQTGTYWAVARFARPLAFAERLMRYEIDEFLSWTSWEHWAGPFKKRGDAIAGLVK